ncbi:MAG: hypothetical protein FJZ61_06495 [Chlamydiae bacterium]|nr:hypothetical protein [Chlamydiota bacterium]
MKLSLKLACISSLCFFISSVSGALSGNYEEQIEKTGSVYIGFQAGPAAYDGRYTAQHAVNTVAFDVGSTSGIAGGCIGIDGRFGVGYAAIEGNVYYDTLDTMIGLLTSSIGIPNHVIKAKNSVLGGALLKLGFFAEDTALYVLGGFSAGRWTLGLENDSAISYNRGIQPQASVFFNHNLAGAKVGAGVRFPIQWNWLVFDMQYSYNWYGDMTINLRDLGTDSIWTHTLHSDQHMFLFSLNFSLYDF